MLLVNASKICSPIWPLLLTVGVKICSSMRRPRSPPICYNFLLLNTKIRNFVTNNRKSEFEVFFFQFRDWNSNLTCSFSIFWHIDPPPDAIAAAL